MVRPSLIWYHSILFMLLYLRELVVKKVFARQDDFSMGKIVGRKAPLTVCCVHCSHIFFRTPVVRIKKNLNRTFGTCILQLEKFVLVSLWTFFWNFIVSSIYGQQRVRGFYINFQWTFLWNFVVSSVYDQQRALRSEVQLASGPSSGTLLPCCLTELVAKKTFICGINHF